MALASEKSGENAFGRRFGMCVVVEPAGGWGMRREDVMSEIRRVNGGCEASTFVCCVDMGQCLARSLSWSTAFQIFAICEGDAQYSFVVEDGTKQVYTYQGFNARAPSSSNQGFRKNLAFKAIDTVEQLAKNVVDSGKTYVLCNSSLNMADVMPNIVVLGLPSSKRERFVLCVEELAGLNGIRLLHFEEDLHKAIFNGLALLTDSFGFQPSSRNMI